MLYTNLGWFAFTGVFLYAFLWQVNKYKSKFHKKTWGVLDIKRDKRHNKSSEAFHHAKMLKLYGWEQKFLCNINTLYDEENELEQKQQLYNKVVDFIPQLIDQILPLIVFCSYSWWGNEITLAQLIICEGMIRRLNGNIGHVIHHFNDWENLQKSLGKVHDFYHAHELQKGVVNKDKDSELAIALKGNFSRGINLDDEEEEDEEKGTRCNRLFKSIWNKLTCKKAKVAEDKKDDDKKSEEKSEEKAEEKKDEDKTEEEKEADKKEEDKKKKAQCLDEIITLKDIDLQIKKGEFVCIIGEIGSGKSTLLLSMLGELLYVPQSEIDMVGGDMKRQLTG